MGGCGNILGKKESSACSVPLVKWFRAHTEIPFLTTHRSTVDLTVHYHDKRRTEDPREELASYTRPVEVSEKKVHVQVCICVTCKLAYTCSTHMHPCHVPKSCTMMVHVPHAIRVCIVWPSVLHRMGGRCISHRQPLPCYVCPRQAWPVCGIRLEDSRGQWRSQEVSRVQKYSTSLGENTHHSEVHQLAFPEGCVAERARTDPFRTIRAQHVSTRNEDGVCSRVKADTATTGPAEEVFAPFQGVSACLQTLPLRLRMLECVDTFRGLLCEMAGFAAVHIFGHPLSFQRLVPFRYRKDLALFCKERFVVPNGPFDHLFELVDECIKGHAVALSKELLHGVLVGHKCVC